MKLRSRRVRVGRGRVVGLVITCLLALILLYDTFSKVAKLTAQEVIQARTRQELEQYNSQLALVRERERRERRDRRDLFPQTTNEDFKDVSPGAALQGEGESEGEDKGKGDVGLSDEQLKILQQAWSTRAVPTLVGLKDYEKRFEARNLFLHQGNYKRLLQHYAKQDEIDEEGKGVGEGDSDLDSIIKNSRSFPDSKMIFLRNYDFDSCAIVGNSGSLLNSTFGKSIDSHAVVLRFNQAPQGDASNNLARHVGTKTTFRLVNTRWTNKYGSVHFLEQGLPLEPGVTLVVTRASPRSYDSIAQTLKKTRPDVKLLYLSSRVIGAARKLLVAYRRKLESEGFTSIPGGNTPSSGFVGVYTLMQVCRNLTAYGFGLDNSVGRNQNYHYFHILSPEHDKKKNSMNPTHSFHTEKLLLRSLASEGRIEFCGSEPGDRRLRRNCGLKAQKVKKNQVAADSFEFDFIKTKV